MVRSAVSCIQTCTNIPPRAAGLDVHYVAEYHETLHHVLVFLNVQGMTLGANLEAEVVPVSDASSEERSRLIGNNGRGIKN